MRRTLSTALLTLILCSLILSACGSARRTPQPTAPVLVTAAPTASATATTITRTPSASQTPRPTDTSMPTSNDDTQEPTESPTQTPFPAITPEDGVEAYRLKPWDYRTAFRIFDEAESVPLAEEYENLREFYQLSMLYEIYLKMPEYKTDRDLLRKMAERKGLGNTYWYTYGLLHDYSIEPYRKWLEQELNTTGVIPPTADAWMEKYDRIFIEPMTSSRLFDQSTPATVIQVRGIVGWNFFVIRQDASGRFTVQALYPEWKQESWNEETFQITDLNANGRDEIAVEYHGWGTGMSHFCRRQFKVYEWDGSAWINLFGEDLNFFTGTDYSDCLPVTFLPDPNGGKMVQTGITYNSVCPDEPYQEIITFKWDGKRFREQPDRTSAPPNANAPDHCTIEWALDARWKSDTAVLLLEKALANWPVEAEQEWGPAARDFVRLYLATCYIERGQIARGLALLTELRDKPVTPEYPLPSKLAKTFLDLYPSAGLYRAIQEMDNLYSNEQPCLYDYCDVEEMREIWGYFEQDWEYGSPRVLFTQDFTITGSLNQVLSQNPPESLEELNQALDQNKLHPLWIVQGDMDGHGEEDWLVAIEEKLGFDDCPWVEYYAYLRKENRGELVFLNIMGHSIGSSYCGDVSEFEPGRWKNFYPDKTDIAINILQNERYLYTFRFIEESGKSEADVDLWLWMNVYREGSEILLIQDWFVQNNRLIVQYEDRQISYAWDSDQKKLVPTGSASELQEENISKAEQAIYFGNEPAKAVDIINTLLKVRVWENFDGYHGRDDEPPKIRPYALYLLGLAYEQAGDSDNAVRAYWQLWHDYPTNPYSIAAQSKLERK